jgi:hypothetical protein
MPRKKKARKGTRVRSRTSKAGKSRKRVKARRSRKTRARARKRASFATVWKRLGNAILRAALERGWDRRALVIRLASDPELRRHVVEGLVQLFPARAPRVEGKPVATQIVIEEPAPNREDELADEYALAARRRAAAEAEAVSAEGDPANWRLF